MSIRDMVSRKSDYDETMDYFPTPAYATRALFEHVIPQIIPRAPELSIWDPACGGGHMCAVFEEYGFKRVIASDITDYGYPGTKVNSFQDESIYTMADLIVTNPPYAEMHDFVRNGLRASGRVLALLTRIQFLEGQQRYKKVFSVNPPTTVAIFSDRIPFKMNVTTKKVSKMFTHCWCVWDKGANPTQSRNFWIPPDVMDKLEKPGDWDE